MTSKTHAGIYYRDQAAYLPEDFQALWRYLNRMFINKRGLFSEEIASLDLSRMSEDTLYLMKHLLILQGLFEDRLTGFPNLAGLRDVPDGGREILLSTEPTFVHDYFNEKGIYL